MARVVVLNGISSAGKSSLARTMQAMSRRDWLHVSLDQFIGMIPVGREFAPEWFLIDDVTENPAEPGISFTSGPRGEQLMRSMRDFVAVAATRNLDLIVDDVCTAREIGEYRTLLSGHRLLVIRVEVPLEIAERRERDRGDRMIGLARHQMGRIHEGIAYDLVVENTDGVLAACAAAILAEIEG